MLYNFVKFFSEKIQKKACNLFQGVINCFQQHAQRLSVQPTKTSNKIERYTTMNNITITPATASAAILAIAGNVNIPAPERALLIKNMLEGRTFRAVYSKANPELDEQGNPLPRIANGSTNYAELALHSVAYKAWLKEQEYKAAKGVKPTRKQPHEYGNVSYWDFEANETGAFRQFKVGNLISIELVD